MSDDNIADNPPLRDEPAVSAAEIKDAITRERDRRILFRAAVIFAIAVCTALFSLFACWVFNKPENAGWHIGLVLVLPPTSILLTLIGVLRYKAPKDDDPVMLPPQLKQLAEQLAPIKELFR